MKTIRITPLVLALAAGCVSDAGDVDFRIINGEPAPSAGAPEWAATVGLVYKAYGNQFSSFPSCSGTLIAPDVVLTAAHCMVDQKGWKVTTTSPGDVRVFLGDSAPATETLPVSETWVHPNYDPRELVNDIALVRLSNSTNLTPIPALPAALGLTQADVDAALPMDHVGYGYSDLAKTEYGEKLHNVLPLGALGCTIEGCPAGVPADTQFSYSQLDADVVEGPCNGDSGGPQFIVRDGVTYVAGITSWGDAQCDLYGVSTTVDAYEAEIEAFIADAPPPGPDCSADGECNEACDDDPDCAEPPPADDCGDGICGAGESCDGRNGTSSCSADCDGVTKGKPTNRYCWVEGTCEGPGC
jgi:secreted trypsin-like serine protease